MPPEPFAIAIPKLLLRKSAPEGADSQPPENDRKWVIQPDDRLGAFPDQIADDMIIPRNHPSLSLCCHFDTRSENLKRRFLPVGFPVQRIQLDKIAANFMRQFFVQRGFA